MELLRELHLDAKLLKASRGIRAFVFSYLNVVFAIYLDRIAYSTVTSGVIFTVAYLSGAVLTALRFPCSSAGLQLINDVAFYLMFRYVLPPEERRAPNAQNVPG